MLVLANHTQLPAIRHNLRTNSPRNKESASLCPRIVFLTDWKLSVLSNVLFPSLPLLNSLSDYRKVTRFWKIGIDGIENIQQHKSSKWNLWWPRFLQTFPCLAQGLNLFQDSHASKMDSLSHTVILLTKKSSWLMSTVSSLPDNNFLLLKTKESYLGRWPKSPALKQCKSQSFCSLHSTEGTAAVNAARAQLSGGAKTLVMRHSDHPEKKWEGRWPTPLQKLH